MDFQTNMNNTIEYIESNLGDIIDYQAIAKKACCSSYHFQRVFSYVFGVSLAEYIRCRRMTLAAFELLQTNEKVIDLAVKYGYDSQSSFSRAFQVFHGFSPSEARSGNFMIKAFPRARLNIDLNMGQSMEYRIENTKAAVWFGKSIPINRDEAFSEGIFQKVYEFGNEIIKSGIHRRIAELAGLSAGSLLTSIRYSFREDGSHRFMYGAKLYARVPDEEFECLTVADTTWAVFYHPYVIYPDTTLSLYQRIYSEWFPVSGYVQTEGACMEIIHKDFIEIRLPVMINNDEKSKITSRN